MKVQNKKDVFQKIEKNKQKMSQYGIARIGLFGSFVKDKQKATSDIDLLVEFVKEKKTFQNYMKFVDFIEKLFGRRVEIITPESISPYIAPYINKEVKYVQVAN